MNTPLTAAEVIREIPTHWRDAVICVGTTVGGALPVKRVSLHQNRDGRRVVIIHSDTIEPKE